MPGYRKWNRGKKVKRTKRVTKKRPYRGRRKYHDTLSRGIAGSGAGPFPRRLFTKLIYADERALGAEAALATYTYRLNSIYDPDATGVGTQPDGFDTLLGANNTTAPYQLYRVRGALVELTIRNVGTPTVNCWVSTRYGNETSPSAYWEALAKHKWCRQIDSYETDHHMVRFKKYFSIASIVGQSKQTVNSDDNFTALYTGNPAFIANFDIINYPTDGTSTAACRFAIRITYYCELSNCNDIIDS